MQNKPGIIQRHKWNILLSFIVGIFIIFFIVWIVGLKDILNVLSRTNLKLLSLTLLLQFVILVGWTTRWSLILDVIDHPPSFRRLFFMLFASLFGNNITPGSAGGEPLRAYILKKIERTPFEVGFASATADRAFEFFPFALISLVAVYFISTWKIPLWMMIIINSAIIASLIFYGIVIYVCINKEIAQKIIIFIARLIYPIFGRLTKKNISFSHLSDRMSYYIERFSTGFLEILEDHKVFTLGFIITFGMWLLDMARIYICFVAVGSYPPILPMIIIYNIAFLISVLPILPGALGIRETTMVGLFFIVGVSPDVVIAASLIDRLVNYIIPTIIGAFAAIYYGIKLQNEHLTAV